MSTLNGEQGRRPLVSLVVSVYNRDDFLRVVLTSIAQQSSQNFELIIAEDGQHDVIAQVVSDFALQSHLSIKHLTQEDIGFRKNKILNQAICASEGQILIFIDGDCILHKYYVATMLRHVNKGLCLFGRRVMLGQKLSQQVLRQKGDLIINPLRILFSGSRHKEEAIRLPFLKSDKKTGLRGHSFCVAKADMFAINGFDEDFTEPYYGEDTDVERRLKLSGVRLRCSRFAALQYHLHHNAGDRTHAWNVSKQLFIRKSAVASPVCDSGLSQYIS